MAGYPKINTEILPYERGLRDSLLKVYTPFVYRAITAKTKEYSLLQRITNDLKL